MKNYQLICKSLWYYRRTFLMVIAGLILSSAILTGALIVGDSVRYTLKRMALLRLGQTHFVLDVQDRYVPLSLSERFEETLQVKTASVLIQRGTVLNPDKQRRVNQIQVVGVDADFWAMGNARNPFRNIDENWIVINSHLAKQLNVQSGDDIVLRFEKANAFPLGLSFASTSDQFESKRLSIHQIVDDEQFGRFGLESSQLAPYTIFVPLKRLGWWIDAPNCFNKMLIGSEDTDRVIDEVQLYNVLKTQFRLQDAQLELQTLQNNKSDYTLKSDRVFINHSVLESIQNSEFNAVPVLTYFVNKIQMGNQFSPYSFVTGIDADWYPQSMTVHDIVLNQWLAEDLKADVGDSVQLHFDILNVQGILESDSCNFCVKKIVPINYRDIDESLTPDLPGLSDAQNCSDWDFGADIDLDLIRDKDEQYWDQYKETPKAFILYQSAQQFWENVYGNTTAIQINNSNDSFAEIERKLSRLIDPVRLGFYFRPVRDEALRSSQYGVDFGELFLGLSFFVMAAAFLLTTILFHFSLDQRQDEIKMYHDIGLPQSLIYRQILGEGVLLAAIGSAIGLIAGLFYNQLLLWGLSSVWKGTVGTSEFVVSIKPETLIMAFIIHLILAILILWLGLNRHLKRLYFNQEKRPDLNTNARFNVQRVVAILSGLSIVSVPLIFVLMPDDAQQASGLFFLTGGLLLLGLIGFSTSFIMNTRQTFLNKKHQWIAMALHSWQLNKWRHLMTVLLLSLSVFTIIGVGVNRKTGAHNPYARSSGTGGFAFYGEFSLPFVRNLNDIKVQNDLGLLESGIDSLEFLLCRSAHDGDASCLNLNQISTPRILSVDPEQLNQKGAFHFVQLKEGLSRENPWLHLDRKMDPNTIPAVADLGVLLWGMFKSVGDTIQYQNQFGEALQLVLIGAIENSVFQGNVLISESNFEKHFPGNEGYTTLLADLPLDHKEQFRNIFQQNLSDYGIELQDTAERLIRFLVVENTYLSIFMALGGLGVLIGTIGMGILTARNILERRNQLAIMHALGFTDRQIRSLILLEHGLLLALGILIGMLSGMIATWPMFSESVSHPSYQFLGIIIMALLFNGLIWTFFAYHLSTKGELVQSLREE